jgi:pimeloyl-ACP methyl ester carboxylesterase
MQIQVNNFSMAYSDQGRGTPIVLLHGYPLNHHIFDPQLDELSQQARIITPDLRGHGGSQAVPGPYSMDLLAQDVAALLDQLRISEPVILGGLSMGGYVTFAFYRLYPERVKGLILTATRAAADTHQTREARHHAAETARRQGVAAIAQSMLPKLMSPHSMETRPELVESVQAIMNVTSLEGVLGDLAAMAARPDSTPTLPTIRVPTLVVHGAQDSLIPLSEAQAMQQAIPNAHLEVIAKAGHLPTLETPAIYNLALLQYLKQFKGDENGND